MRAWAKQKALWYGKERYEQEKKTIDKGISAAAVVFFPRHELIVAIKNHMPLPELYTHARTHTRKHTLQAQLMAFCLSILSILLFLLWHSVASWVLWVSAGVCASMSTKKLKTNENIIDWLVCWMAGWPASSATVSVPIWLKCSLRMTIVNSMKTDRTTATTSLHRAKRLYGISPRLRSDER